jgi:hypothetical protein
VPLRDHSRLEDPSRILQKSQNSAPNAALIGGDRPLSVNNFVDTPWRYTNIAGDPVLADAHGNQEFLEEHLARMNICQFGHNFYLRQW